MSELNRLRESLRRAFSDTWNLPQVPKGLPAEVAHLKKMLGSSQGGSRPPTDRMREAVNHFWLHGAFRGLGDARLTCFGAIESFSTLRPALIEHQSAFPRLLERVDAYSLEPRPFRRCYRGLLHCYFSYDPGAAAVPKTGVRNWEQLRGFLEERYDAVRLDGFEPEWVEALAENRQLLTEDPAKPYARAALEGDTEEFARVCQKIEIAEASWLVRDLVMAQVDFASGRNDGEFKAYVAPLLTTLMAHPVVQHQGLARVVNRYAKAKSTEEHRPLREAALAAWGNPLLPGNRPKWGHVTEEGRRMVRGWLNREHIRLFFEVLSEDRQTDRRRVDFWTQYFDQIDMTYFALGSNARYSRSPDIKKLRETLGDLRLTLLRGGAAANNAFIMQVGQYVVVEFGVTGNACYVFKQSRLPVELRGEVAGDGTGLKDRGRAEVWLPHVDTAAGRWEDEFRRALEALGIRQTGTSSSRQSVNRPTASRPTGGPTGRAPATQIETFTRENLYGLARRAGVQVTDKTQIGGSLFVHYSRSDGPIASTLKAWGFKYGPTKKAWYRRGWS